MSHGKKNLIKLFIKLWNLLLKTQQDPIEVLEQAIKNAKPLVEEARRIGGAAIQVPLTLNAELY
jgi:ribosomal protein S7